MLDDCCRLSVRVFGCRENRQEPAELASSAPDFNDDWSARICGHDRVNNGDLTIRDCKRTRESDPQRLTRWLAAQ
jgi:hypothetical protein